MILEEIRTDVEEATGLNLNCNTRKREYVVARYVYMALAYKYTRDTLERIGSFVGRDHSTVVYALDNLDNQLFYEKKMKVIYDDLLEAYKEKYNPTVRASHDVKIKNQYRQKKKIFRKINAMTTKELNELESMLLC